MAHRNRFQTASRQGVRQGSIGYKRAHMVSHGARIARHEIISPRSEELLLVAPQGGDERDPAGKRLKDANGWNSRQTIDIKATGDMNGPAVTREGLRHGGVRKPSAVIRAIATERRKRLRGVSNAMDIETDARLARGFEQQTFELFGSLAVSPVADPNEPAARRR